MDGGTWCEQWGEEAFSGGQLLLLRYCGYGEDRRADFWCDVVIADLHPVGWCTQNNKTLMPPDGEHGLAQLSGITCDAQRQTS